MATDVRIPEVGESIEEVQIGHWRKSKGDTVREGEVLVELESDKAALELSAPASGRISEIIKAEGETVGIGEVVAVIDSDKGSPAAKPRQEPPARKRPEPTPEKSSESAAGKAATVEPPSAPRESRRPPGPTAEPVDEPPIEVRPRAHPSEGGSEPLNEPAAGRLDALRPARGDSERDTVTPLSSFGRFMTSAVEQPRGAVMTLFDEVDMTRLEELRHRHAGLAGGEDPELGFLPFFIKAAVLALQDTPQARSEVRGADVVVKNNYDVGVAAWTERGLVAPVVRDADRLSLAEVARTIADLTRRAAQLALTPDELTGASFTVIDAGPFGSVLSTPLLDSSQSAALGVHAVKERPVARDGRVVVRPMMYLALTFDLRVLDAGRAAGFLQRIRESLEAPVNLLVGI